MSPELGIAVMMNNYFHDVATALLAASAVALVVMLRAYERAPGPEAARLFVAMRARMLALAKLALAWIVVGGVPRTIFYTDFEWANAAGRGQVAALVVKHVLMFLLVGAGAWLWLRMRPRVRAVEACAAGAPAAGEAA